MNFPLRLFSLVMIAGIVLRGQVPPKDVDGWGKIKWGMTSAQAKTAYGSQIQDADEKLEIKSLAVGDINMKVSFGAVPGSTRIKQVVLSMAEEPQPFMSALAFRTLKSLLMQKYGRPTDQGKEYGDDPANRTETTFAVWTFPSTVIRLYLVELKRLDFGLGGHPKPAIGGHLKTGQRDS
jgi:hypothetical protein